MFKSLNSLHHAYLLVGDREIAEEALRSFFDKEGITLTGSPDYFLFTESLFGVDSARELSLKAGRKAFTERKIFFIAPEKITIEAQNALLKTFEDPVPNTHFFLVLRDEGVILPTLRSRMQIVSVGENQEAGDAESFLKSSVKERINFARKFADAERNASAFLDDLLKVLRKSGNRASLERVYKARLVSDERGASSRLILEHLATVL